MPLPSSARIGFAKLLDEKASELMKAFVNALGPQWAKFPRGPELALELETFRASLNADFLFQQWEKEMKAREFKVSGAVLAMAKKDDKASVAVNFDSDIADIYQEVALPPPFRNPYSHNLFSLSDGK